MYPSVEPSYLPYWAIAPIDAKSSRAHSRVYEFGGISFVVPSHSKISLNADRWFLSRHGNRPFHAAWPS